MLRRIEMGLPDDLDALTPSQRCEFYRRLGLKALVNQLTYESTFLPLTRR
jgi:hypothetical protein